MLSIRKKFYHYTIELILAFLENCKISVEKLATLINDENHIILP
jgi:hypothetical protein